MKFCKTVPKEGNYLYNYMETCQQYIILRKSVLQYLKNDSIFKVYMCRYSKIYVYNSNT